MGERTISNVLIGGKGVDLFWSKIATDDDGKNPQIICPGKGKDCGHRVFQNEFIFCGQADGQALCKMEFEVPEGYPPEE